MNIASENRFVYGRLYAETIIIILNLVHKILLKFVVTDVILAQTIDLALVLICFEQNR